MINNNRQIQEVINNDLCTGCGLCISESNGSLKMELNEFGFLVPIIINDNIGDDPIRLCPFNPKPESAVADEFEIAKIFLKDTLNYNNRIGSFENIYVGYSNEFRETSSSGGIATYVFERLLVDRVVDHLYIVKEVKGTYEYQLFSDANDIIKISKTRYIPVTLEQLFLNINSIEGTIAISGVACFIKAIRLKQYYHPELKEKIPFLVGIICGGLKSSFFTDYLAQKAKIQTSYSKQDYRIKDPNTQANDYSFGAFDENNVFKQVKMKTIGDMWGTGMFKSNACDFCDDVTTELADISLGDAWIHPYTNDGLGNSLVVTRTALAEEIINKGIVKGDLSLGNLSLENFLTSQQGSFNHRHTGLAFRLKLAKKAIKSISPKRYEKENTTIDFELVQKQRMRVRSNSLEIWKNNPIALFFDKAIEKDLNRLRFYTKIYHKRKLYKYKKNRLFEIISSRFSKKII
jgi:coenzyme F420-reducing hydrogenase beta subunit